MSHARTWQSLVLVLQAVGHLAQQIWSKVGHFLFGTPCWYLKLFVSEATKQTGQLNNTMPKFELLFALTTLGCGWLVILAISSCQPVSAQQCWIGWKLVGGDHRRNRWSSVEDFGKVLGHGPQGNATWNFIACSTVSRHMDKDAYGLLLCVLFEHCQAFG